MLGVVDSDKISFNSKGKSLPKLKQKHTHRSQIILSDVAVFQINF
jgi:hypothetical protein